MGCVFKRLLRCQNSAQRFVIITHREVQLLKVMPVATAFFGCGDLEVDNRNTASRDLYGKD